MKVVLAAMLLVMLALTGEVRAQACSQECRRYVCESVDACCCGGCWDTVCATEAAASCGEICLPDDAVCAPDHYLECL